MREEARARLLQGRGALGCSWTPRPLPTGHGVTLLHTQVGGGAAGAQPVLGDMGPICGPREPSFV